LKNSPWETARFSPVDTKAIAQPRRDSSAIEHGAEHYPQCQQGHDRAADGHRERSQAVGMPHVQIREQAHTECEQSRIGTRP
jgi:hypothetical protein